MNIRFDEGKVVARSICGTKGTFNDYLASIANQEAKAKRQKKLLKTVVRRSTLLNTRKMSLRGGGSKVSFST